MAKALKRNDIGVREQHAWCPSDGMPVGQPGLRRILGDIRMAGDHLRRLGANRKRKEEQPAGDLSAIWQTWLVLHMTGEILCVSHCELSADSATGSSLKVLRRLKKDIIKHQNSSHPYIFHRSFVVALIAPLWSDDATDPGLVGLPTTSTPIKHRTFSSFDEARAANGPQMVYSGPEIPTFLV